MSVMISMKEYVQDPTFFYQRQKQNLLYQQEIFKENLHLETSYNLDIKF